MSLPHVDLTQVIMGDGGPLLLDRELAARVRALEPLPVRWGRGRPPGPGRGRGRADSVPSPALLPPIVSHVPIDFIYALLI